MALEKNRGKDEQMSYFLVGKCSKGFLMYLVTKVLSRTARALTTNSLPFIFSVVIRISR